MDELLAMYHHAVDKLPVYTHAEAKRAAYQVVAARRRYHRACLTLDHAARTAAAVFARARDGDLTLRRVCRLTASELVPAHRRQGMTGEELERACHDATLARMDLNLPTVAALLARCRPLFRAGRTAELGRVRLKVAALLDEIGVKTPKLDGLAAEAASLPPEDQNETADSLKAQLAVVARRRAVLDGRRQHMARGNLKLAWNRAAKKGRGKAHLTDLIGHANVGLLKAIDRFDPVLGWKFSTMAANWIDQAVGKALTEGRAVKVPPNVLEVAGKVHWARAELARAGGPDPSFPAIVAHIRRTSGKTISAAEAERADRAVQPVGHLDADPDGEDAAGQSLAAGGEGAEEVAAAGEAAAAVQKAVRVLPYRQRMVLHLRFGLGDGWKYTLAECGHVLGTTREYVRQIEATAVAALRQPALAELLAPHFDSAG